MKAEPIRWSTGVMLATVGIVVIAVAAFGWWAIDQIPRDPTGERRQDVGDAIGLWAQSARAGDRLDLSGLTDVPWDRAAIFDSYAPNEKAQQVLGFDWNIDDSRTAYEEVGNLIGFAEGNRITAWAVIPQHARFQFAFEGDAHLVLRSQPEVTWTGTSFEAPQ